MKRKSVIFFLSCLAFLNFNVEAKVAKGVKCEKIDLYNWDAPIGSVTTCFMNINTTIDSAGVRQRSARNEDVKGIIFDNNNKIAFLPDNIGVVFPNLLAFSAQACSISSIAYDNFKYMTSLVYLNLANNQITSIDSETLNDVKNVERIDLSKNKINNIENSFKKLSKLQSVDLTSNEKFDKLFVGEEGITELNEEPTRKTRSTDDNTLPEVFNLVANETTLITNSPSISNNVIDEKDNRIAELIKTNSELGEKLKTAENKNCDEKLLEENTKLVKVIELLTDQITRKDTFIQSLLLKINKLPAESGKLDDKTCNGKLTEEIKKCDEMQSVFNVEITNKNTYTDTLLLNINNLQRAIKILKEKTPDVKFMKERDRCIELTLILNEQIKIRDAHITNLMSNINERFVNGTNNIDNEMTQENCLQAQTACNVQITSMDNQINGLLLTIIDMEISLKVAREENCNVTIAQERDHYFKMTSVLNDEIIKRDTRIGLLLSNITDLRNSLLVPKPRNDKFKQERDQCVELNSVLNDEITAMKNQTSLLYSKINESSQKRDHYMQITSILTVQITNMDTKISLLYSKIDNLQISLNVARKENCNPEIAQERDHYFKMTSVLNDEIIKRDTRIGSLYSKINNVTKEVQSCQKTVEETKTSCKQVNHTNFESTKIGLLESKISQLTQELDNFKTENCDSKLLENEKLYQNKKNILEAQIISLNSQISELIGASNCTAENTGSEEYLKAIADLKSNHEQETKSLNQQHEQLLEKCKQNPPEPLGLDAIDEKKTKSSDMNVEVKVEVTTIRNDNDEPMQQDDHQMKD